MFDLDIDLDLESGTSCKLELTSTKNGPELWQEIIEKLPGAVIAGGAVRDYLLGVEPKDIDLTGLF